MERARVVEAMEELALRRDNGEPVHSILRDVADDYDVNFEALKTRAEQSWGVPLETDHERNAAHFAFVKKKPELEQRARVATRKIWEVVAPVYSQRAARLRHCEQIFSDALDRSEFDHPGHLSFALSIFRDEFDRLSAGKGRLD
jgi:hypothetical protein